MKLCTLDIATSTGWTLGAPGEKPAHGTFVIPETMRYGGRFPYAYITFLDGLLAPHGRDVRIVYEQAILRPTDTPDKLLKLYGLVSATLYVAHCRGLGIPQRTSSATWRSSMLRGFKPSPLLKTRDQRSEAFKEEAMRVARLLGYDFSSHDEAEAILLWEHEAAIERSQIPFQKKNRRKAA